MRLGWSVVSPGNRPRGQVLAEQGRAVVAVAVGLIVVLLVAGLIESLVTPSPLPTFARIAIGVAAEIAFLAYVIYFGRKGVPGGGDRRHRRRAGCGAHALEPAGGLHRQVVVGKCGSQFLRRRIDDVDTAAPQPRRHRAPVVAGAFGRGGIVDLGGVRAASRERVDPGIGDSGEQQLDAWRTAAAAPPSSPRPVRRRSGR